MIVNAYTQKSVRAQSRNDEGPILVGKGNNATTGPHANAVRGKLAASNDAALPTATGRMLIGLGRRVQLILILWLWGGRMWTGLGNWIRKRCKAREVLRRLWLRDDPGTSVSNARARGL